MAKPKQNDGAGLRQMTRVGRPLGSAFAGRAGIELILLGCPMTCLMPTESLRSRITTLHVHAGVSIHAPRAGRDHEPRPSQRRIGRRFNPRAPRGARPARVRADAAREPVSIHAPRAGRDVRAADVAALQRVSIHAPRAGRDLGVAARMYDAVMFQSTRPARGATC